MKIQKRWLVGGLATLLLGATSCQKSNNNTVTPVPEEGSTYMSVAINLNMNPEELLRAGEENNEHNDVGHWKGRDKITGVDIYLVDDASGTVETKALNEITAPVSGASGTVGNNGVYATPAWKVQPGAKTLYVVVNNSDQIKEALKTAAASGKDVFETAYKAAYDYTISKYAKEEGAGTANAKDVILMTGEPKQVTIQPNITQSQATIQSSATTLSENNNQFGLEVRRSAARVAVTYDKDKLPSAKGKVESGTTPSTVLGNIEVNGWYYGQFEKQTKVLWDKSADDKKDSPAKAYLTRKTKSPNWDFIVEATTTGTQRTDKYDYSTLNNLIGINPLASADRNVANIIEHGNMKFLTETTHQYGTEANTGYRKGNTPYVLIETVFTPADDSWASTDEKTAYTEGKDLYYSTYNGKFYSDKAKAVEVSKPNADDTATPAKDGVITYTGGKMYYTAWLNPDTTDPTTWFNSPVLRNNIYHIHVTGFKKLGFSGDPFNPTPDNDKPVDPDDDVPGVTEKLNTKETWMSTEITVVNWGVHSYDISF